VLFGLTNEPHTTADKDAMLATVYQGAIAAIRAVEDMHGSPHHIVVAQAPEGWSRDLTYFISHPLSGDQIAYEVHPYNAATDFGMLGRLAGRKVGWSEVGLRTARAAAGTGGCAVAGSA
jgi:hypothetical protein